MSEKLIPKVEKSDIKLPELKAEGTAIILQRHEKYERDRNSENAGSLTLEHAEAAKKRDLELFDKLFSEEDAENTFVLFVSSDTQYAGKGHRSLETGQLAQDAAIEALEKHGLDPAKQVINFNPDFNTHRTEATDQNIRTMKGLVEPQIFETEESLKYVAYLREKYGKEDGPGAGLSPNAWGAHEMDAEKEIREAHGAEGVYDMLDRTKHSIEVLERYSRIFHHFNPGKKLVVWATTHYDTISPLVKDATNINFGEYVGVDYGAGVVIDISPGSESYLNAQGQRVRLNLGKTGTESAVKTG